MNVQRPNPRQERSNKLDVRINNYINGRQRRREKSFIPIELAIGGASRSGTTDSCGKKVYSEQFIRKNHKVYPMEKLKKALEDVRVSSPTLSNSVYKGFARPGEKETAQFFKSAQACSFFEVMRAVIQQNVFDNVAEVRHVMALTDRSGLKMVEWTPSTAQKNDLLFFRCKKFPACRSKIVFTYQHRSL